MVDSTSEGLQAERKSLALFSESRGREYARGRSAQGSREQEGSVVREQGTIRQDSLDQATCGQEALDLLGTWGGVSWGERGKAGRPEPSAFLSLQPARTSLHRSQCPQEVDTPDWR